MPASFPKEAAGAPGPADPYLIDDFARADENPVTGWNEFPPYAPMKIVDGKLRCSVNDYCAMQHPTLLVGPDPWWVSVQIDVWPEDCDLYVDIAPTLGPGGVSFIGLGLEPGEWWGHAPDDRIVFDMYAKPYAGGSSHAVAPENPLPEAWVPGDCLVLVFDGVRMRTWVGQGESWTEYAGSPENANSPSWAGQSGYLSLTPGPGQGGDARDIVIGPIRGGQMAWAPAS